MNTEVLFLIYSCILSVKPLWKTNNCPCFSSTHLDGAAQVSWVMQVFAVTLTLIYPHTDMQLIRSPLWGCCQRTELFAGFWQKVTVALSSAEGQRASWIAGVWGGGGGNGWQMFTEDWLHFCNHKTLEEFCAKVNVCACALPHYHRFQQPTSISDGECCGENTHTLGSSVSLLGPLSRWLGSFSPGVQAQCVLCGPPIPPIPSIFYPPQCGLLHWLHVFHSHGTQFSGPSRLLSSYRQRNAYRVRAVILKNWERRG